MEHVILNNGVRMPILGFGVYQIPDAEECERAVFDALSIGYRFIDTAAAYLNEEAVGRAIRRSGVPRDQVFVTTKLWIQDHGYEATIAAFERSHAQAAVGLSRPLSDSPAVHRRARILARDGAVTQAGAYPAIGVSNFQPDRLMDLIDATESRSSPLVNRRTPCKCPNSS
jgi:2,5-diketo-D-gluconate reductase A